MLEKVPSYYLNLVAVRTEDLKKPYVDDIAQAYQSQAFKQVVEQRFPGFYKPDYLR